MNQEKIGKFLKELRINKKLSQEELSKMLYVDRAAISKWENGFRLPSIDKMCSICEIFDVSLEELLSGEKENKNNLDIQKKTLFQFLLNEYKSTKKIKKILIILIILVILISFLFLLYYFKETYNKERVYFISGYSDNYEIKNGFFIINRENSYFRLGSINDSIYDVGIYYDEKLVYSGSSDNIIIDFYGYNSFINFKDLDNIDKKIKLVINDEEVKLNFQEVYQNDNLILEDNMVYGTDTDNEDAEIPEEIKEDFECNESFCIKESNNLIIRYGIIEEIFYITDEKDINIQYVINQKYFSYSSNKMSFDIMNDDVTCNSVSCDGYQEIYKEYYNLIKEYLN